LKYGLGLWHLWGKRGAYSVLVGKLDGKRVLARPWCRLGHNMKVNLKGNKLWMYGLDWYGSGKDEWLAVVVTFMNLRFPSNAGNFLTM
jgi:hypothetical protein